MNLFAIVQNTGYGDLPSDYPAIILFPHEVRVNDGKININDIMNRYCLKSIKFYSSFEKAEEQYESNIQNACWGISKAIPRHGVIQFEIDDNQITQIISLRVLKDVRYSEDAKKYIGLYSFTKLSKEQLSLTALTEINRQYLDYRLNNLSVVTWLLQGMQLVKQGKLSFDTYLMIYGQISGLAIDQIKTYYDQSCLKYIQKLMIYSLQSHVGYYYNTLKLCYEYCKTWFSTFFNIQPQDNIAATLIRDCQKNQSLTDMKLLLNTKICFFKQNLGHERQCQENLELEQIIERNHKRIIV